MAESFKATLSTLITDKQSLPKLLPAPQSYRVQQLKTNHSNAKLLREIFVNVDAFLNVGFTNLKTTLFEQFATTQCDVEAVNTILAETLEKKENYWDDARGVSKSFCVHVRHNLLNPSKYFEANDNLNTILAKYDKDQIVKDSKSIHFYGKPNSKDKLAVPEKKNPNIHTTAELLEAELEMKMAHDIVDEQQRNVLIDCSTKLKKFEAALHVIENFVLILVTLWYHARAANAKNWSMCEHDSVLHIKEMRPYWMDNAIHNDVCLHDEIMMLTAPNGGGKSTLLRGVAAVSLLTQCGLFSPCAKQSTIPKFNSIFLRTGTLDCAYERRSSFANEMVDITAMLNTSGKVLMLVDEPCSNTRPSEGSHLLASIVNNIPKDTIGIITTHFDEVNTINQRVSWHQLTASLKGHDCVPDFALTSGKCTNSMAICVAIASGMPSNIVKELIHDDDTENQVLDVIYKMGLNASKWTPGEYVSAMHMSVVYVLIMEKTVYVGETDRVFRRFHTHVMQKNPHTGYIVNLASKSQAMVLESRLQRELTFYNVRIESLTDMAHGV